MLFCYPKIIYAAEILRAIQQLECMPNRTTEQEEELYAARHLRNQCNDSDNGPNGFESGVPILIRNDYFVEYLTECVKVKHHDELSFVTNIIIDKYYSMDATKILAEYDDRYAWVKFNNRDYRILILRTRAYEALMLTAGTFGQRQITETI